MGGAGGNTGFLAGFDNGGNTGHFDDGGFLAGGLVSDKGGNTAFLYFDETGFLAVFDNGGNTGHFDEVLAGRLGFDNGGNTGHFDERGFFTVFDNGSNTGHFDEVLAGGGNTAPLHFDKGGLDSTNGGNTGHFDVGGAGDPSFL